MANVSDLEYLAGVTAEENAEANAPTNVHVVSGEVASGASSEGKVLVEIDGIVFSESDSQYIEIESIGGLEEGDTVTILLTGEAGHGMSLLGLGSVGSVDRIVTRVATIESDYVKAEVLEANYAHITNGVIDNATIDVANINDLDANYAHITNGVIDNATIGYADVDGLNANYAHITDGVIDNATIGYADVDGLNANYAHITNGVIDNASISYADVDNLNANYAHINNGVIDNATISYANVDNLSANYARIDGANITSLVNREAWIDTLMVQSGLLAQEGTVYSLDAIQVNATNITAGTIDVERLILTVDGEKYFVTFDEGDIVYEKLDGNVIEDLTITADKIVAGAITAEKITTQNIVGTGGWINLRNGTFAYVNAHTGQGIVWNGTSLYVSGNVEFGSSSISLSALAELATDTSEELDNLTIGGTNLFYNMPIHGTIFYNSGTIVFNASANITSFIAKLTPNTEYTFKNYHGTKYGCDTDSDFMYGQLLNGDLLEYDFVCTDYDDSTVFYDDSGYCCDMVATFNSKSYDHIFVVTSDSSVGFDETAKAKIEVGNKATDWTPAIEDITVQIEEVRDDAYSRIDDVSDSVGKVSDDVAQVQKEVDAVRSDLTEETTKRDYWLTFRGSDGMDIGAQGSTFRTNYTNTDINFMDDDEVLMNLSGTNGVDAPKISSDEVHLGNWMLVRRANNNLSLKYVGPSV